MRLPVWCDAILSCRVSSVATFKLPLSLLKTAQGQPMLVELKNGDTYNGRLENCDSWMNIKLKDVIFTSRVSEGSQSERVGADSHPSMNAWPPRFLNLDALTTSSGGRGRSDEG